MQEILSIGKAVVDTGSFAALIGLLVVLAVPKLRKKILGENGYQDRISVLDDFKVLA